MELSNFVDLCLQIIYILNIWINQIWHLITYNGLYTIKPSQTKQLYSFKYSYQMQNICTQLYDLKYACVILIIYKQLCRLKLLFLFNNHLFSRLNGFKYFYLTSIIWFLVTNLSIVDIMCLSLTKTNITIPLVIYLTFFMNLFLCESQLWRKLFYIINTVGFRYILIICNLYI